jgi:hypothetical protein
MHNATILQIPCTASVTLISSCGTGGLVELEANPSGQEQERHHYPSTPEDHQQSPSTAVPGKTARYFAVADGRLCGCTLDECASNHLLT